MEILARLLSENFLKFTTRKKANLNISKTCSIVLFLSFVFYFLVRTVDLRKLLLNKIIRIRDIKSPITADTKETAMFVARL